MSVYVDDMKTAYGRMIMCHMEADTREELDAMADKIGVARKWIQYPGTPKEHYDVCLSKRARAIELGAIPVTWRWVGKRYTALRDGTPVPPVELSTVDLPQQGGLL